MSPIKEGHAMKVPFRGGAAKIAVVLAAVAETASAATTASIAANFTFMC